jgi:glycosyltransferase involved in cell wall biosynthesis
MIAGLVSCIVPTFNGARHLAPCLDSMLAQTYRPTEIIVVDDGSSDGTREVATSFGERVRYIYQHNAGPPAARNTGVAAACGEFVAFNDADDLWHPEKLERQMAHFTRVPSLQVSITLIQNFLDLPAGERSAAAVPPGFLAPKPGFLTQTMLLPRAVFDLVGSWDTQLVHSSERDWFLRARGLGVVVECLPEVLTQRRLHGQNLSQKLADASREEHLRLIKRHLDTRRRGHTSGPHGDR